MKTEQGFRDGNQNFNMDGITIIVKPFEPNLFKPMTTADHLKMLDHLQDYLNLRIELISEDPKKFLGDWKPQIFTFEYYLKNCVIDKGGKYDFTQNRYKVIKDGQWFSCAYWFGTAFNLKQQL